MDFWGRCGLIGATGFVGGNLAAQRPFDRTFDSRSIAEIAGEDFDTLVCAGAPASMWQANANPEQDRANLDLLADRIAGATVRRLILISTIAVFDDAGAGYTEADARYETAKAYGRNRRHLEQRLSETLPTHVVRLPALFGPGLKKNFVFDILNPVPSFIRTEKFTGLMNGFSAAERRCVEPFFALDAGLDMFKLDRDRLTRSGLSAEVTRVFEEAGFLATAFTHSDSVFQYYDLANLAADLETCVRADIAELNVCSAPWRAGDVHLALTGRPFENTGPAVYREDVRTVHAAAFGKSGDYLYGAEETEAALRAFAGVRP